MAPKILVTGGAGFIGGSVIAEFLSESEGSLDPTTLSTTVRSPEQVQALSKLGIDVFQIDLDDEKSVVEAILQNEIDIVVHTASSAVPPHVHNLIKGLGQRRQQSGSKVYYIHTGITAIFTKEGGWPFGEVKDSDDVYQKEKQIGPSNPVRAVDILVVEESKAHEVTAFNVVVPNVYGKGSGEWRKISVRIPALVRTSIEHKTVYKFDIDSFSTEVHISDLAKLYVRLVFNILKGEDVPSGENGYFFGFAHRANAWALMERLASSLYNRGLVASPQPQIWPSYEMAADRLGWPREHVRTMGTNSGQQVAVNAYRHLNWRPQWDEKRYMESTDEEIDLVLNFDDHAPTLFKPFAKQNE